VIKGIFLILKRSYETYHKELQTFIEIYINGRKKKFLKEEEEISSKNLKNSKTSKFSHNLQAKDHIFSSLNKFSLLSEDSAYLNESSRIFQMNSESTNKKGKIYLQIHKPIDNFKKEEKFLTEKKTELSKYSNKHKHPTLNMNNDASTNLLYQHENELENFNQNSDNFNIFSEREQLDLNFIYSKDLFSNFINFNLEEIRKETAEKENLQSKSFHDNNQNLFEDQEEKNNQPVNKQENSKTEDFSNMDSGKFLFNKKKPNTKFKILSSDKEDAIQMDTKTAYLESSTEIKNFRKTNVFISYY